MPAWLLAALALAAPLAGRIGPLARRAAPLALGVGAGALAGSVGIPGVDLFPDGKPRRRRRRRALTATDRADIAFLTGILGRPAGKELAIIIASRTG